MRSKNRHFFNPRIVPSSPNPDLPANTLLAAHYFTFSAAIKSGYFVVIFIN